MTGEDAVLEGVRDTVLHLRRGGTSVVFDLTEPTPVIVHWGPDLGELDDDGMAELVRSSKPGGAPTGLPDDGIDGGLPAQNARGHLGVPTVEGHRDGRAFSPLFVLATATLARGDGVDRLILSLHDDHVDLALDIEFELGVAGLLRVRGTVVNTGGEGYQLDSLLLALPVPAVATELADQTGRWTRERSPQRRAFTTGLHVRESRDARGHDAPLLFAAGEAGFANRRGQVWAVHLGWSGNHRMVAEHRMPTGQRSIGGGELLLPGEGRLQPGERYEGPWLYGSHGTGLDDVSARFHDWLRARPEHPTSPRPVLLNVWEAVYFDHDLERLKELADVGAAVGIERFVLDDGWFLGRRDDTAGLGDWIVDPEVWPEGLGPLIDHVTGLGMEFGLWVEPEMVNPDSGVFRTFPEWVLQVPDRDLLLSRNQAVLDLTNPAAWRHVHEQLDRLLADHDIGFVKWDHNRSLVDAGSQRNGRAAVRGQTLAAYRLFDSLRARHPTVEFESCASGGGRIDLGIMERAERVWASDTIDALERQQIDLGTKRLLPPELVGSHVGAGHVHTTGRLQDLHFRAATAMFGHMGVEWDLPSASDEARHRLARWISLYKEHRGLLHSGRMVVADHPDPAVRVHGIVAHDQLQALFTIVQVATSLAAMPGRVRIPGLDRDRTYRVEATRPGDRVQPRGNGRSWWPGPVVLPGTVLEDVGIQAPVQFPERAVVIRFDAVDG